VGNLIGKSMAIFLPQLFIIYKMARNELIGLWSDMNFEQQIEFSLIKILSREAQSRFGYPLRIVPGVPSDRQVSTAKWHIGQENS
jgi:hypothetical protein